MGYLRFTVLALALLCGCSGKELVQLPPRMELKGYGPLGIIEFGSQAGSKINVPATRQFQEQIQAAQPGTPFLELGTREAVLAGVGAGRLDAEAWRKIGAKHGVAAVFVGEVVYSEPKADIRVNDLAKLDGGVRAEMRGDISGRLVDTRSGATIWSSSAWAKRQLGRLNVSEHGVSASVGKLDPREEMVPALVYHLTQDFRPSSVRR
jgi:hypothetical protein